MWSKKIKTKVTYFERINYFLLKAPFHIISSYMQHPHYSASRHLKTRNDMAYEMERERGEILFVSTIQKNRQEKFE